jgi:hypothetical protein
VFSLALIVRVCVDGVTQRKHFVSLNFCWIPAVPSHHTEAMLTPQEPCRTFAKQQLEIEEMLAPHWMDLSKEILLNLLT